MKYSTLSGSQKKDRYCLSTIGYMYDNLIIKGIYPVTIGIFYTMRRSHKKPLVLQIQGTVTDINKSKFTVTGKFEMQSGGNFEGQLHYDEKTFNALFSIDYYAERVLKISSGVCNIVIGRAGEQLSDPWYTTCYTAPSQAANVQHFLALRAAIEEQERQRMDEFIASNYSSLS